MDIEPFAMCATNAGWSRFVTSSDGKTIYHVQFEKLPQSADYEYGFTCTCQAFKFGKGKECKHIKQVKGEWCGWHQQHDGGEPTPDHKCPKCGGEIVGVLCAV